MIDSCQCLAYVGAVIPRSKVMKSAIISFFKFIKEPGTPASTILRKLVRFFIINIFLIIKTLSNLKSDQYPIWMTQKPGKGDLKAKFPGWACPQTALEVCAFDACWGNQSVFILDTRLGSWGATIGSWRAHVEYLSIREKRHLNSSVCCLEKCMCSKVKESMTLCTMNRDLLILSEQQIIY